MFESLSDRLSGIFDKLTRRGALTDSDVAEAMREVRRALLEADVALEVVREFTEKVREKAVGQEVVKSVTPGQMVVKIVHDELVAMLGSDAEPVDLAAAPPVPILMVGLQGSGKTTSTAKIARRLTEREKKKVLMASLDTRRPAAQEQLRVLGEQTGVATLPIIAGQTPIQIANRAMDAGRLGSYDVVMLDTAGRTTVDEELMREVANVRDATTPHEILLVADSLTGQDAVNTAKAFEDRVGITGIVLTRVDGDGRGGAALSMRAVTGKPFKLLGTGEKWDALEDFHPERIAGRILGMGDIVSLVERAAETIEAEKAEKIAQRMKKGEFDLNDLAEQIKQMEKLGGMGGVLGMLPGVAKAKDQLAGIDDKILKHQHAIIMSMTKKERANPKIIDGKRWRRIAAGSGTGVPEVNKLLKMHRQMADMMKQMGKNKGLMAKMFGGMGMGGGMPQPTPEMIEQMKAGEMPKGLPGMGGGASGPAPKGLPGLGGGLPGLGGAMPAGLPGLPGAAPVGAGKRKQKAEEVMAPELETERLRLRYWREDDWQPLSRFFGESKETNLMGGVTDAGFAWRVIACHVGHWQWRGYGMWAVEYKPSGDLAGFCGPWHPADWPELELGWSLLAPFRGQGLATEAAHAARNSIYEHITTAPIVSLIEPGNTRSVGVAKRLGCTLECDGTLPSGQPALFWRHPGPEALAA